MTRSMRGLIAGLFTLCMASAAFAAPITMSPDPVALPDIFANPGVFSLSLVSGDSDTGRLDFEIAGPGGCGFLCSPTGAHAMVFDGVTLTGAGATDSGGAFDLLLGPITPFFGDSAAAWAVIDSAGADDFGFYIEGDGHFTTATIYSLAIDIHALHRIETKQDFIQSIIQTDRVRFSAPVPEPSAALVFGVGVLMAGSVVRNRRS